MMLRLLPVYAMAVSLAAAVLQVQDATLSIHPAVPCKPTELTIRFRTTFNLTAGDEIAVPMYGFTNGDCDNHRGSSINDDFDEITSTKFLADKVILRPSSLWKGSYHEGSVKKNFYDSHLFFTLLDGADIANGTLLTINVGAGNRLKVHCGLSELWNGLNTSVVIRAKALGRSQYDGTRWAALSGPINITTPVEGGCTMTDVTVEFDPPQPKLATALVLQFIPGMRLLEGDNVTFTLGGVTSGNATGQAGLDLPFVAIRTSLTISNASQAVQRRVGTSSQLGDYDPIASFNASWTEGSPVQHTQGFINSSLILTVMRSHIDAGTVVTVLVKRSNALRVNCGLPKTYEGFAVKVEFGPGRNGLGNGPALLSQPMPSTALSALIRSKSEPVGDGCRSALSSCSGHGDCDYCLNRCVCDDGYGSSTDIQRRSPISQDPRGFPSDCSGKVCPFGPAISHAVPFRNTNGSVSSSLANDTHAHLDAECSGIGVCDRKRGICECPSGWAGTACERMLCPTSVQGLDCSGHGQCFSMRQLSAFTEAFPLSLGMDASRYMVNAGAAWSPSSWDAEAMHACVCDSSWEVGLGSNKTQESEWFGPDCSLRRCPGGDDPATTLIDETDCANVTASGGRGVGLSGNLCHVDCSNRGTCDHSRGLCSCFEGYAGHNCATQIREK